MRDPSPLEAALERVGDRWSLLLVEALLAGPRRFNELGEAVPGIAPNILTDRLRRLERERQEMLSMAVQDDRKKLSFEQHRARQQEQLANVLGRK